MKAIVIGAGRIGRGYVTELLLKNDVEVTFFEAFQPVVDSLNTLKSYTIHVLGNEALNTKVENVVAYSIDDATKLAEIWQESDYIFTAVGGKNMGSIGEKIANAYSRLYAQGITVKSDIITCENWVDPAKDLRSAIQQGLSEAEYAAFDSQVGITESVVMATGTGSPDDNVENPMDTWVQDMWYLPVDVDRLKHPAPAWQYIEFVTGFNNLLQQKLYTNNTSVGSVAFLGNLLGLTYVAEAANDPRIEPILDQIYEEINEALVKGMGVSKEDQEAFSKRAKKKYTDYKIVDQITRIARDPIRKLGPTDRLIGPMKFAEKAHVVPNAIALATAAALFYEDPEDEAAVRLQAMREEHGVAYILETISGLTKEDSIYKLVLEKVETLKEMGWI